MKNELNSKSTNQRGTFALTMPIFVKNEINKLIEQVCVLITLTEGSRVYKYQALIRALKHYKEYLINKAKELGVNLSLYNFD